MHWKLGWTATVLTGLAGSAALGQQTAHYIPDQPEAMSGQVNPLSFSVSEGFFPTSTTSEKPAQPPAKECEAEKCKKEKEKAPKPSPFKGLAYDNDFKYLDKPCTPRCEYFEHLKRTHVGCDWIVDLGGQYRHQFKNEDRRSLFSGVVSNPRAESFTLNRVRAYANAEYQDWLRVFGEYIDASDFHEDLPPLGIDVNRSDVLNAFADVRVLDGENRDLWGRVGRQELLYGDQRLISPLDWANTRRTFEGAKGFTKGECWDFDTFWVRPVITDDVRFDQADYSQWLAGAYFNYKGFENFTVNPYLLVLRETAGIPGNRVGGGNTSSTVYTYGMQIKGSLDGWLWDIEGAMQAGNYGVNSIAAGMCAVGVGRKVEADWTPTWWVWYDYASGDNRPGDGTIGTFNQLFPLAHKYYGFLDLVARQNAQDFNAQLFLNPHEKVTLLFWQHFMWLAAEEDALYNAAGAASRVDPTGASGNAIGNELDMLAIFKVRPGVQFTLGYCHFWSGNFVLNTGGQNNAYLAYSELQIEF